METCVSRQNNFLPLLWLPGLYVVEDTNCFHKESTAVLDCSGLSAAGCLRMSVSSFPLLLLSLDLCPRLFCGGLFFSLLLSRLLILQQSLAIFQVEKKKSEAPLKKMEGDIPRLKVALSTADGTGPLIY